MLSPILFLIMINDVPDTNDRVKLSMFADDCSIWKSGGNLQHNASLVQNYFNQFHKWCDTWGFKISKTKTTAVIFSRKNDQKNLIQMKIGDEDIRFESTVKFLGVIFDKRLTWTNHINYVIDRCNKRLNLQRALSGTDWGANKKTLLLLYRTLIRSVIDYGAIAYDSASKTTKQMLNSIQSKALRICCGAMMMTPVAALQIECGETPLELRRQELQLQYATKPKASRDNPTKSITEDCWQNYVKYPDERETFAIKTKNLQNIIGNCDVITQNEYSDSPFWKQQELKVDNTLAEIMKKETNDAETKKRLANDKMLEYCNSVHVYTDASKRNDGRVGVSVQIPSLQVETRHRINNDASVFTAEASAILLALNRLNSSEIQGNVSIFTDCLEVTTALKEGTSKTSPSIINQIRTKCDQLQRSRTIQICVVCIPGHIGILGNEAANAEAIRAADHPDVEIQYPISTVDAKQSILKYIDNLWQMQWNASKKGHHYKTIQPTVTRRMKLSATANRKREVIQTRLRLGKCCMNSYLQTINRHPDGNCSVCNTPETIEHYILECQNNVELSKSIKDLCERLNIRADLADILKYSETLDTITDFIIKSKRRIWTI